MKSSLGGFLFSLGEKAIFFLLYRFFAVALEKFSSCPRNKKI
ncbi:hypothetical protein POREN0001_0762 [Porphyromonas endodontalis ATCC 35406]|uniref:Uncharacterized protein n=1 Tax=Porphyromonas endodontalis (strain ATCC 35406 / DSM 24491 / JCM 8526 / CCUG 16442 / BCRC 14492 / NCTC 13058 / HG 370) TaxID=553175 RepID=C3J9L1_POREA|nr:hypothetical protein POREN0001_0762 [Porphyromonas endodontalis ATCC 35406]